MVRALEAEAQLHRVGRGLTRRFLLRLIEVRFRLMAAVARDPGIAEEEIHAPVVVAGAPRTGTTILHRLLAADRRHRVPWGWELLRPVPASSEDPAADRDARIALAEEELGGPQNVVSDLRAIHTYGATRPKECLSAMSFAFQSEEFTARYAIPSYEAWLVESDMRPAYRMHRLVLQLLQRRQRDVQWVLKSPVHLHSLNALLETYPDARVAVTHRHVPTLLASLTSLIATLRWAHSDRVDPISIADAHVSRYARTFDALVDVSQAGPVSEACIHHSHQREFRADALRVVRDLYSRFGLSWTAEVEAAMADAAAAPADDHAGAHRYDREVGSEPLEQLEARFARYHAHFGVRAE